EPRARRPVLHHHNGPIRRAGLQEAQRAPVGGGQRVAARHTGATLPRPAARAAGAACRVSLCPMRGVVAAGHPLTAEAGARVLREGGNAVDAAVAASLMSFAAESPLTGPGAGGFMLVHTPSGETHLLDFFVAAPGRGLEEPSPADLVPAKGWWDDESFQLFSIGASSCGVYGTTRGLAEALRRFGTMPLSELVGEPA